jgi:hypothetical protein
MTEVKYGKTQSRHLCSQCAEKEGVPVQTAMTRDKLVDLAKRYFAAQHGRQPTEDELKALLDSLRKDHPELFDE